MRVTTESQQTIQSYIDTLLFEQGGDAAETNAVVVETFNPAPPASFDAAPAVTVAPPGDTEDRSVATRVAAEAATPVVGGESQESGVAKEIPVREDVSVSPVDPKPTGPANDPASARKETGAAFVRHLEAAQRGETAPHIDTRPDWGKQAFSVLGFNVSGLKLAIVTHMIDGIQPLDLLQAPANDELESPLYMGVMRLQKDGEVRELMVVDTARLVMPERYTQQMREGYRSVLLLDGSDWCLAIDSISGELELASQQVRWRSEHTRREWLAGTVIDRMCALIDADTLARHLLAEQVLVDDE